MLRASTEAAGTPLDPRAIIDASIDPLVDGGRLLVGLADTVLGRGDVDGARSRLEETLGPEAAVDACAVIANFEMMNRIAEGVGMPVGKGALARSEEWRSLVGLDRYRHD